MEDKVKWALAGAFLAVVIGCTIMATRYWMALEIREIRNEMLTN